MTQSTKTKIAAPLFALATAIALSSALPSSAQAHSNGHDGYRGASYDRGADFDFRGLERRIAQGVRTGDLTRREAKRLSWQVSELRDLADDYSRRGMSRFERRDLRDRYDALSARVYRQRHDDDRRDYSWR